MHPYTIFTYIRSAQHAVDASKLHVVTHNVMYIYTIAQNIMISQKNIPASRYMYIVMSIHGLCVVFLGLTIENVLGYTFSQVVKRRLVTGLVRQRGGGGGGGEMGGVMRVSVRGEWLGTGDKGGRVGVHLRGRGGRVHCGGWPEGVSR